MTEQLWSEFGERLLAWFRRRTDQEAEAEDLRSETFLRIHDGIDSLEDEERIAAWVFRVASNVLIDHRRARAAAVRREAVAALPEAINAEADPSEESSIAAWVARQAAGLPDNVRDAVRLTELESMRHREAAETLGVSLSAMKSRAARGRERLKRDLLACCHLEFDARGTILVATRRRPRCCDS